MAEQSGTMEGLELRNHWHGREVLITGHTGFKGAWLAAWLVQLGARVHGIGLPAEAGSLWERLEIEADVEHHAHDIRDLPGLCRLIRDISPQTVFHLAAQPLVRQSYSEPVETWSTNVMGSIHVMEALREAVRPTVAVMVTTDKVYENNEWDFAYREVDRLGGHDPYSSSKAAAEIAVDSWRKSFFESSQVAIATVRAGNVIGGGDFAENRIIPDVVRSLHQGSAIEVRNPMSTRPWQHVLEPLRGYMLLARAMDQAQTANDMSRLRSLCTAWNFGAPPQTQHSVSDLVEKALEIWPGEWRKGASAGQLHEAQLLQLSSEKAHRHLNWWPRWGFAETVRSTIDWYRAVLCEGCSAREKTVEQIEAFECC